MTVFVEGGPGGLRLTIPKGVRAWRFDNPATHGLTHCMKPVDFVVELDDSYLFLEFKDPQHSRARPKQRAEFVDRFRSGRLDGDLTSKYRDSFLYEWARGNNGKPIFYYVLVALDTLTPAELVSRTDDLRRKLPLNGPPSGAWKRAIVAGCAVFNIEAWNKHLPQLPVARVDP